MILLLHNGEFFLPVSREHPAGLALNHSQHQCHLFHFLSIDEHGCTCVRA